MIIYRKRFAYNHITGKAILVFKRKIYDKMVSWKRESQGRIALLVQGARRIGKSTIAEEFAKNEYKSYIMIDFSNASSEVARLFRDMSDLDYFFLRLQMLYHVRLYPRESLIIFDEVQLQPLARQAIKHLVKDRRYDYLETGSLISIRKNIENILIPSEERKLPMYPMDYEEFLWAKGDEATVPLLRECYAQQKSLGNSVHRKQMRDFRLYMLVGGMPQAVEAYLDTNNFEQIDSAKRTILDLYENDFRKIDQSGRAAQIFDAIPAMLGKQFHRYKVSIVIRGQRSNDVRNVVADLQDSMTVLPTFKTSDPGAGLSFSKDIDYYKMYICDTGLFVTLAFKDKDFTENVIYEKLLRGKLQTNLGYLYENAVAQILQAKGDSLFYYTFQTETSNHIYEVDFLLARQHKICPIEVKSSHYLKHASLDRFRAKFGKHISDAVVVCTNDYNKQDGVKYIPIYMAQFL